MASTITFCMENPIKTNIDDWMFGHIGRVSVGIDKGDHFEILAYSDDDADSAELCRLAKANRKNHYKYINSFISEGVTAID